MSEMAATQSKPTTTQSDKHAFAQVDKWMALIRDISHERSGEATSAGARLERLLATATE